MPVPDHLTRQRARILRAVHRAGRASQRDLVRATRLSASSVSVLCRQLLAAGALEVEGTEVRGGGRPLTWLRLAADGLWSPRYVDVDGLRLCYREAGDGEPVVLIHGFRGSGRYWSGVAPRLAERARVVAPDLKGFGDSAKPPRGYTLADHTATLRRFLAAVGVGPATLIGHSLGGVVALRLVADFPELVKRLVLITTPFTGTVAQNVSEVRRAPMWIRLLALRPHTARWIVGLHSTLVVRLGSDTRDLTREAILDATKFRWASLRETFYSSIVADNMRERLRPVDRPALLVYGDQDDLILPHHGQALRDVFRPSELVVIPGAGHQLPTTHQQAFLQAVERFLGR